MMPQAPTSSGVARRIISASGTAVDAVKAPSLTLRNYTPPPHDRARSLCYNGRLTLLYSCAAPATRLDTHLQSEPSNWITAEFVRGGTKTNSAGKPGACRVGG